MIDETEIDGPAPRIIDYEVVCPDEATAIMVGGFIGAYSDNTWSTDGVTPLGHRWSLAIEGHRMVPTGNTVTDRHGNNVPEMLQSKEFYLHFRWYPTDPDEPFPTFSADLNVIVQPDDGSHMRFM